MTAIAVVGAGISGLVAAHRLSKEGHTVTVYEAAEQLGGTLSQLLIDDKLLDVGAEAFITRRPEVLELLSELGLTEKIVYPVGKSPALLVEGRLVSVARNCLMGIPSDSKPLQHLISEEESARIDSESERDFFWTKGMDISVGELVATRYCRAVVSRSVDPLLTGVYSADADNISLRAAIPALAKKFDDGAASLSIAVRELLAETSIGPIDSVFGSLQDTYRTLTAALESERVNYLRGVTVSQITGGVGNWGINGENYAAVVVALPARSAAELFGSEFSALTTILTKIDSAGSAVVILKLPRNQQLPEHSGILVASDSCIDPTAPVAAKAFTFLTNKWSHLSDDYHYVRVSFGKYGENRLENLTDNELIKTATTQLEKILVDSGYAAESALRAVVQRWPVGLPHYAPGHVDRISNFDSSVPPTLAFAGASYSGVGVPACIGRAESAARAVLDALKNTDER